MTINQILSEAEEIEIRKLLDNAILMSALKKILLKDIYESGTLKPGQEPKPSYNFALSLLYDFQSNLEYKLTNQELGEKLRASIEGIRCLDAAFSSLEKFRKIKQDDKENPNQAR